MPYPLKLRCVLCGAAYAPGEAEYTCPACGLDGTLDVLYDYKEAARTMTPEALGKREGSLWRYREILPIEEESSIPSLSVGWTPLYDCPAIAGEYGIAGFYVKVYALEHGSTLDLHMQVIDFKHRCLQFHQDIPSHRNAHDPECGSAWRRTRLPLPWPADPL